MVGEREYLSLPPNCRVMTEDEYLSIATGDHMICPDCQAAAVHHCIHDDDILLCSGNWLVEKPTGGYSVYNDQQFRQTFRVT